MSVEGCTDYASVVQKTCGNDGRSQAQLGQKFIGALGDPATDYEEFR